jgi:hypothetical protein
MSPAITTMTGFHILFIAILLSRIFPDCSILRVSD